MHSLQSFQPLEARFEISQLPDRDGLIFRGRYEPASVAGESQAADRVDVAAELTDLLPCRNVVELQARGSEAIEHSRREHRQGADRTRPRRRECKVGQLFIGLELNLPLQVSIPPDGHGPAVLPDQPRRTCLVGRNRPPRGLGRDPSRLEVDDEIAGRWRAGRIPRASLGLLAEEQSPVLTPADQGRLSHRQARAPQSLNRIGLAVDQLLDGVDHDLVIGPERHRQMLPGGRDGQDRHGRFRSWHGAEGHTGPRLTRRGRIERMELKSVLDLGSGRTSGGTSGSRARRMAACCGDAPPGGAPNKAIARGTSTLPSTAAGNRSRVSTPRPPLACRLQDLNCPARSRL